jgi:hypothetical protein
MTSFVKAVTWDCGDALLLARFWAAALGTDVDEESSPERAFVEAAGWGGPNMWFIRVPEAKAAKNRLHFDLRPLGSMEEEIERLTSMGATTVERFESHVVMRDPEGNEFCMEPGTEEGRP